MTTRATGGSGGVRSLTLEGGLDIELDPDGNLWLSMMYQAGVSRIDRKTHEVKAFPFPKEWQSLLPVIGKSAFHPL